MEKITNYLNIARVRFVNQRDSGGAYQYANFEGDLGIDDICVVRTEENRFLVAEVVEIIDSNTVEMYREVVAKVDMENYDSRRKFRAKAAELKAKMETRAKQLQDIALYQMLAENDPDMAALLNEYKTIPNA